MHARLSVLTCVLLALFFSGGGSSGVAATQRELSHAARFSDSRARLQDEERDATASLERAPDDVDALLVRARARLQLGNSSEGLADFERAASLAPARADIRAQLALAFLRLGRFADAKHAADAVLAIEPENPAADYALGVLLLAATTDVDGAVQHLERAAARGPATPEVRFDLLRACVRRGDRVRSMVQLRVLRVLLAPDDSRLLHAEGLLAARWGRLDQAVEKFRSAAQASPELPLAPMEGALAIARALARTEKSDQAIPLFAEVTQRFPESVEAHDEFAKVLEQAGRAEEARAERDRAQQLIRKLGVASIGAGPRKP